MPSPAYLSPNKAEPLSEVADKGAALTEKPAQETTQEMTETAAAQAPGRWRRTWQYVRARLRPPRRLRFTREGRYFAAISIGIGLAAINTGNNLLYLLLGWMLSVIIASGVLSELTLRNLRIQRKPTTQIFAGRPFLMEISVDNQKRRVASFSIEVEDLLPETPIDKKCFFLKVPAGSTQRTSYQHQFARRGAYIFSGFRVGTKFPFALFRKSRDLDVSDEILVLPNIYPVHLPAARAQRLGATPNSRVGRQGDFFGLREYRYGDDRRDIHWRTTARGGRPLVREYESESQRQVTIIIDSALPADVIRAGRRAAKAAAEGKGQKGRKGKKAAADSKVDKDPKPSPAEVMLEALEHAVSMAASLAVAYIRSGYGVRLIGRGGCHVQMGAGPQQVARILRALALLPTVTEDVEFSEPVDPRIENVLVVPHGSPAMAGRPSAVSHVLSPGPNPAGSNPTGLHPAEANPADSSDGQGSA